MTARLTGPSVTAEQARIRSRHDGEGEGEGTIGVSVPATSANLGPGYDSFGVALDVPLVLVAGERRAHRIVAVGQGADELPTGDDNLVWQAVLAWCAFAGTIAPDVSVRVDSAIPLQRGMGSSSAAAVAGLMLGRALTGGRASTEQLLGLATDLEGHPDNAAAAIAGGLVACTPDGRMTRVTPAASLRPLLVVPGLRQSTGESRGVLPASVTLAVAAGNGARATTTFLGLAGLVPLDARDMVDELHEPARLPRMPVSAVIVDTLRAEGIPCALSGSGPTVLVVLPAHDDAAVARVRSLISEVVDPGAAEIVPTRWDLAGATVCPPGSTLGPST